MFILRKTLRQRHETALIIKPFYDLRDDAATDVFTEELDCSAESIIMYSRPYEKKRQRQFYNWPSEYIEDKH